MVVLAGALWPYLAGAGVLGVLVGLAAGLASAGPGRASVVLALVAVVLLAIGLAASVLGLAPGRFGYGLDVALLLAAPYLAGCALGTGLRGLLPDRRPRVPTS